MKLSITTHTTRFLGSGFGFRRTFPGRIAALGLASLGSLALVQHTDAKAPDGVYKFTSGSGKVEIGGQPFAITKARLKEINSVKGGSVIIKNGKITLDRNAARNVFNDILKVDFKVTVKGPSTILFSKSGSSYRAMTPKPVVANLKAVVADEKLAGVLRSDFDSKVSGGKLIINVKFDGKIGLVGSVDQQKITGSTSIVCNR